jgi:hypothetical protein
MHFTHGSLGILAVIQTAIHPMLQCIITWGRFATPA